MDSTEQTRELFATWQRSMEQGLAAWQTVLGHGQAPRPDVASQLWTLLGVHGLEAWMQALQQGKGPADALAEWKRVMDQSLEATSRLCEAAMASEGFAAGMGATLDQSLAALGPLRKTLQGMNEELLRTLNLPSRTQVTGIATQLVGVDDRLEAMESRLEELTAALAARPAPPAAEPAPTPEAARPKKNGQHPESKGR
jgi:hypothetical protein